MLDEFDEKTERDEISSMIIFYFLSLNKPEFTDFSQELADQVTKDKCLSMAWYLSSGSKPTSYTESMDGNGDDDLNQMIVFLNGYCTRKRFTMIEWLKSQMKD